MIVTLLVAAGLWAFGFASAFATFPPRRPLHRRYRARHAAAA